MMKLLAALVSSFAFIVPATAQPVTVAPSDLVTIQGGHTHQGDMDVATM
jgi:hypothetical protein